MATDMATTGVAKNSKLRELLVEQLQDIYWAEKKLAKALDKMAGAATSPRLRDAFDNHRQQTKEHINRLERVFESIDEPVDTSKCPAMAGIIAEATDLIDETDNNTSQRDAGLIIAAQKAEHYEIATYGSLAQLAEDMGYLEAKDLLGQTLEEEKMTDMLLSEIAKSRVNEKAAMESDIDNNVF